MAAPLKSKNIVSIAQDSANSAASSSTTTAAPATPVDTIQPAEAADPILAYLRGYYREAIQQQLFGDQAARKCGQGPGPAGKSNQG